jgi:hypothetical protein
MVHTKGSDGKYHIKGKVFEELVGSRAQVWHGTAYKTSGNLKKMDIMKNKNDRIVSKSKHATAKKEQRLLKAGYGTKKGKFGFVKVGPKKSSKKGGTIVLGFQDVSDFSTPLTGGKGKSRKNKSRKHHVYKETGGVVL